MQPTYIGDLKLEIPIIQGGMGVGVSLDGLAAAVANEGGVGTISAIASGFKEKDFYSNNREASLRGLEKIIRQARAKTKGILAVNIMVALTNFADLARVAIAEGIDLIISGAGLPLSLPEYLTPGSKTKLVPIISTSRALNIVIRKWLKSYNYLPDAVILESPYSGGHQGVKYDDIGDSDFDLEQQLPKVLELLAEVEKEHGKHIPVFVAGGVQTGADIRKFIEIGAAGAQIGTRFVTTHECDASQEFKDMYIRTKNPEDIVVINSPVGLPLRVLRTKFVESIQRGERKPVNCYYKCLHTCVYTDVSFCIAKALIDAQVGNIDEGLCCSGVNGWMNNEIVSVHELIEQFKDEYRNAAT